jgi:hypothetical protein
MITKMAQMDISAKKIVEEDQEGLEDLLVKLQAKLGDQTTSVYNPYEEENFIS